METVISLLHEVNPYEAFEPLDADIQGWNSTDPAFQTVIERVRPRLIVEVGTWKGASAIHMARTCADIGLSTTIVCVDTWLGSVEFWTNLGDAGRHRSLRLRNGYPQVYYQFISNVIHSGLERFIVPFPQTSINAAAWFSHHGLSPDLVYLDASHERADVAADIAAWLPVVRPGGVLFGDDYDDGWPGVMAAVDTAFPTREVIGKKWAVLREQPVEHLDGIFPVSG